MAGMANYKRRQCSEKRRYRSEEDARDAVRSMQYRRLPGGSKLHAYLCSFCQGWHVGKDGRSKVAKRD
jgi:hypothetical protein